jgi:uncharacterized membrane protein (UPF0127 family)
MPKITSFASLLFAGALALSGCGAGKVAPAASPDGPTVPNPRLQTVEFAAGSRNLKVELARTADEREKGLMYRKALGENEGMLFVFGADEQLAFWMKNTSIPLSIAYIASDGTIREIHDLEPFSLDAVKAGRSVRYALEVGRGWFEKAGLREGDRLSLPALD